MTLVNKRGETAWLNTEHAQWDSHDAPLLRLADYAEPFFVYCIGVSAAIAFTASSKRRSKRASLQRVPRWAQGARARVNNATAAVAPSAATSV